MKDEIVKLLAERYFGKEDINDWAIKCLEKGYDSKSLQILSSMSKWDSDSELDYYFQRSLKELGWDEVEKEDYLMSYAKILAGEIVKSKTDPIKASRQIYQIQINLDYPSELYDWFEINDMIWDYEHFVKTNEKNYFFRPKEQLISEIKRASQELIKSEK